MGLQNGLEWNIPKEMKAVRYNKIKDFSIVTMPVPSPKPYEILIKGKNHGFKHENDGLMQCFLPVKSCGICGTDLHIHNGDFDSKMPVVTGHETSGIVVKIGENVKGFQIGDKVTADNSELCGYCYFCRSGKPLLCENFLAHGVHRR